MLPELLEALNRSPWDNSLRGVIADYLEEAGDPRAEQLRLSLQLDDPAVPNRASLEHRLASLLEQAYPIVPTLENSLGMTLVYVPPGRFRMGSPAEEENRSYAEAPQHWVTLTQGFYLGKYAVTQEEYAKVMGHNPSFFCANGTGKVSVTGKDTRRYPVEQVSWEDATEFCRKLSAQEGREYRLPTEAEWEYACRGKTTTPFHFGGSLNGAQANCHGGHPYGTTEKGIFLGRTTSVGSYAANAFGLCDMHGNVWEWCADWYDEDEYQRGDCVDPTGPTTGSDRVIRGGSWNYNGSLCQAVYRIRYAPSSRILNLGCRLACSSVVR